MEWFFLCFFVIVMLIRDSYYATKTRVKTPATGSNYSGVVRIHLQR